MTEELDRAKRRCVVCGSADWPAYNYIRGQAVCGFTCLTQLVATEMARPENEQPRIGERQ